MVKKRKNPGWAAFLNFFIPGLGYVYAGKRMGFGIGLVFWDSILLGLVFILPQQQTVSFILDGIVMAILFAYDGYKTAQEVNEEK